VSDFGEESSLEPPLLPHLAFNAACRLSSALPAGTRRAIAHTLSAAQYRFDRRRREAVHANLRALADGGHAGLRDAGSRERAARRIFESYLAFLLEFLAQGRLDARAIAERIRFRGMELLYGALAGGRGAVITVPHLGNWEVAGLAVARLGFPIHVVTGVQFHPLLARAVRSAKERARILVSTPTDGFLPLLATLRAGGLVALLVDGDVYARAVLAPFFGRRVPFPAGPALLARRSGAPVLHAHAERNGADRLLICFDGLDAPDRRLPLTEDVTRLTAGVAAAQERNIAAHVEQWCIFRTIFENSDAA
jgi:KDO2-lipid IV(A) lauroyltransferase